MGRMDRRGVALGELTGVKVLLRFLRGPGIFPVVSRILCPPGKVRLTTNPSTTSPFYLCYLAAQAELGYRGFLSEKITVKSLLEQRGNSHHVYPREYLKRQGLRPSVYNQVGNLVFMEQSINIAIGQRAPADYFASLRQQTDQGSQAPTASLGGINERPELLRNLRHNAIPSPLLEGEMPYPEFLTARRKMMAALIRDWYAGL